MIQAGESKIQPTLSSAIRIEIITIIVVIVEAGVSIYAGIQASSTALIAFGADSLIELITAVFLLWRFKVQWRNSSVESVKRAEKIAAWVAAIALAALCVYIVADSIYGLWHGEKPEPSQLGIIISIFSLFAMPYLAVKKRAIAKALNSPAMKADAACSMTCAYMAGALLAGLLINSFTGWGWIDSAVSLLFLIWLIPETKEAFEGAKMGELACECE
ncbi:MAG: cation transporter [Bacteroidota bacterium]|nr:cation transporter [Bacteroidota bacterium]MDP4231582.1 cation transporter [Bacteroidota bacterium]MDP4236735.1 cation transporter [Bacteroidota bacterium]